MELEGISDEDRFGDVRAFLLPRGASQLLGDGTTHSEVRTTLLFCRRPRNRFFDAGAALFIRDA